MHEKALYLALALFPYVGKINALILFIISSNTTKMYALKKLLWQRVRKIAVLKLLNHHGHGHSSFRCGRTTENTPEIMPDFSKLKKIVNIGKMIFSYQFHHIMNQELYP